MSKPTIDLPVDEIVRQYRDGKTLEWLANNYCVCHQTILNRLHSAGTELRGKTRKYILVSTTLDWDEEVLDAQDAMDEADVLRDFGISP